MLQAGIPALCCLKIRWLIPTGHPSNPYGKDPDNFTFSNDDESAAAKLHLLCIKERCAHAGLWLSSSIQELNNLSAEEFITLLKSQGFSETEQQKTLERRSQNTEMLAKMTCQESSASVQIMIGESCLSQPVECSNR